jgi:hypothetical protein
MSPHTGARDPARNFKIPSARNKQADTHGKIQDCSTRSRRVQIFRSCEGVGTDFAIICVTRRAQHRLDQCVEGALVLARSDRSLREFGRIVRDGGEIQKLYRAVCVGKVERGKMVHYMSDADPRGRTRRALIWRGPFTTKWCHFGICFSPPRQRESFLIYAREYVRLTVIIRHVFRPAPCKKRSTRRLETVRDAHCRLQAGGRGSFIGRVSREGGPA